jgi:hypothetical protein
MPLGSQNVVSRAVLTELDIEEGVSRNHFGQESTLLRNSLLQVVATSALIGKYKLEITGSS